MRSLVVLVSSFLFTACFDLVECNHSVHDKYTVSDSYSGSGCYTIYRDLDNGGGIGRIPCVSACGSSMDYVVARIDSIDKESSYWIIDATKDNDAADNRTFVTGPLDSLMFVSFFSERDLGVPPLIMEFN